MQQNTTPDQSGTTPDSKKKQQQTDPNITELKGLTDPNEKLEPEGTDNPFEKEKKDKE